MKKLLPVAAAALALLGASPAALAATQIGEYFSFSGFGTLGAVQTDSDQGKFGKDRQIGGADKAASLDVDSNLGLQVTGTATPWLDATVQVLVGKRSKDHLETDVEWAFVTAKPIDGLRVRLGRMAGPVFAVSDSRNVGFANTWVRAPNEVYAMNFFRTYDGVDVTYRRDLGAVALTGSVVVGETTEFKSLTFDAKGKKLQGLSLQLEYDWLTLRASKFEMEVSIPRINVSGSPYSFTGVGLSVDHDNLVGQAEFVQRRVDTPQGRLTVNADGWYAMAGYRFGKLLPYAIVAGTKPKTAGVADSQYVTSTQNTKAVGVRWDALSSAAIKFQLDRIDTKGTKGASFTTPTILGPVAPGFPPRVVGAVTRPVTALSVAVDFTF
jgi:hypothetical protein